ncbi:MAG TPA: nuclear transport factor 2 family protein [Longimicrobiaceae bacterium]|nr:nuclear transport factor 2 family protein [Longimicrobiaceae bacterium]
MNRWLVLVVALGLMTSCVVSASGGDEQAVRDAAAKFYSALQVMFTGDAGPMKDVWSHAADVTFMGPSGELKRGWPAVLADWETQAALKLGGDVQPVDMHVTVGRDLALTNGWERGQNVGADGKVNVVSIRTTNVFRKEGGSWKMIGHHTDLLPFLVK